jgi:tetratricopeptide (TPR) repeat protein
MTRSRSTIAAQAKDAFARADYVEAERLCRLVLMQQPRDFGEQHALGVIAVQTRRLDIALELLSQAVAINPRHAMAHTYLGAALLLSQRATDALRSTRRALKLQPNDTTTLNIHACILGNLSRHEASIAACDAALKIKPDYLDALINRGHSQVQINRLPEALASFEHVLRLKADFVEMLSNCGNVLKQLRRFDEALQRYDQALKLRPDYAEAAFNRGVTLGELLRPREAAASYERALEINPQFIEARYNLGLARLQMGDFAQGWKDYESRWQESLQLRTKPEFTQPLWLGAESLKGKTILLHAEAGLGDTLQFCRYAKAVAARGARVVMQVQRPLVTLLTALAGTDKVLPNGARLPAFDYHCPLMSLPLAFKTALKTIPADVPYVHSDPARVAQWRKRLGRKSKNPRIGLVWRGNPAHRNDENRSLALTNLLPLLQHKAEWISLQHTVSDSDAAMLEQHNGIRHFGAQLKDFADTAALVALMDMVITVDTSVAHLAGAMGKPVWILLPFNPDWRWLLARDDSPWYPSARLLRQPAMGDWASAITKAGKAIKSKLK